MIDDTTAQHADFAQRVEDRDIGGCLGVVESVIVLGVEKARILYGHYSGLMLPLDAGRTEIDHAISNEFVHPIN